MGFTEKEKAVQPQWKMPIFAAPKLPAEYHKVWRSYQSRRSRGQADEHTKELMRQKVKRLQAQKGVTNYRIYTDLKLNPGNLNA